MNAKKVKKMRRHAREFAELYKMDPGTVDEIYKSIKKGANNAVKLARFMATAHKPTKCPKTILMEESHDTNH